MGRLCAASLTLRSSASSLHATLMRSAFRESLITAAQRQFACPSAVRILPSIAFLIDPGCTLLLSSSPIRDVSMVQYSVSVIVDGVVPIEVRVWTLLGRLLAAYEQRPHTTCWTPRIFGRWTTGALGGVTRHELLSPSRSHYFHPHLQREWPPLVPMLS